MQNRNVQKRLKREQLNLRLEEIEAERDRIQQQLHACGSVRSWDSVVAVWGHTIAAAVTAVAVACLLSASVFHSAQSNVPVNDPARTNAISTGKTVQNAPAEPAAASDRKPPSRSDEANSRLAASGGAHVRQWGPALPMPEDEAGQRFFAHDPQVEAQQENLLTLGFIVGEADGFKGPQTRQAITEFRSLYLPDSAGGLPDKDLAVIMQTYADLARKDAARFGMDQGIVAAIRLSSVRTGVDFSYLMKLAATESNFEPASEAATSSATGLYQFTRDTWLNTLKKHSAKYGLVADYAAQIGYKTTRSGYLRPVVQDPLLLRHLLALRRNPRLSAMMAAETVRDNQQKLAHTFDREPTETDLYLTHFLGMEGAITFLRSLKQSPGTHAVELFPQAANSNYNIFHPAACDPRTVDEVYALFGEKLRARRFDEPDI